MDVPVNLPGPTLGVIGGGQLGRMLAEAASPLGVDVIVIDPTPDCPASRVASDQIVAPFDDPDAVEELADRSDAITLEIELADPTTLESVSVPVEPAPWTLEVIQDKLEQMRLFEQSGVPVPRFMQVDSPGDLSDALDTLGSPIMLKARTGGYDGRGNIPVSADDDKEEVMAAMGGHAMAEAFVEFDRELAVIATRGVDAVSVHSVTETIHEEEILRETVVPARTGRERLERAHVVARQALDALEGRGVFGIELFETSDGEILLNEVAPRPHNSGHWTIEGAVTSQFEQHIRAVLGWPLGSTERIHDAIVTANLLGDDRPSRPGSLHGVEHVLATDRAHLHWYGKHEVRPLRKMGHLTMTSDARPRDEVLEAARDLRDRLSFGE